MKKMLLTGITTCLMATLPCFADSLPEAQPTADAHPGASAPVNIEASRPRQTILMTTAREGQFQILNKLIEAADLQKTLSAQGPFTLFAPTDEAFKKLPAEQLEKLQKDKEALKRLLKYHVISGNVTSAQVASRSQAETLEGEQLRFSQRNGKVYVNDAQVVTPDIQATNGIIHAIDKVLAPGS